MVRLSSVRYSNDYLEGRLVSQAINRLADEEHLGRDDRESLQRAIDLLEQVTEGFCFCLSEEDDLLSQWRGYADDGRGVAIGFSKEYLSTVCEKNHQEMVGGLAINRVQYDLDGHMSLVRPAYEQIKSLIKASSLSASRDVLENFHMSTFVALAPKLFLLKAEGFSEESEWRLVSLLVDGVQETLGFHPKPNRLVPYKQIGLHDFGVKAINRVCLGPKHVTSRAAIEQFLRLSDFPEVEVDISKTSYR